MVGLFVITRGVSSFTSGVYLAHLGVNKFGNRARDVNMLDESRADQWNIGCLWNTE